MPKKKNDICIICGKEKRKNELIKHRNTLLGESFSICRQCANENTDFSNNESIVDMCMLTNLPFSISLVEKLRHDAKLQGEPDFGAYVQRLAPYKKMKDFGDSEFGNYDYYHNVDTEKQSAGNQTFKVTDKIEQRWGDRYSVDKYEFFEKQLQGLIDIKPPTTSLEYERYIQNVKLKDVLNEALQSGDSKAIPQLRKSYNDDLKELGFDVILNAQDDSGETFGQKVKKLELKGPIVEKDEFSDVSKISHYVKKWFVIPMKRTFGRATEEEVASLYDTKDE
ncbi:hypothetical protein [Limosilactobacillus reuteri]|uniref:hypothetical protein n=1 Tax=Limosilactobacillus reuteri TaxID=1598 RepID=UPI001CDC50F6|nr:hypothetical protein [Limosilactobacillus reuteri]